MNIMFNHIGVGVGKIMDESKIYNVEVYGILW